MSVARFICQGNAINPDSLAPNRFSNISLQTPLFRLLFKESSYHIPVYRCRDRDHIFSLQSIVHPILGLPTVSTSWRIPRISRTRGIYLRATSSIHVINIRRRTRKSGRATSPIHVINIWCRTCKPGRAIWYPGNIRVSSRPIHSTVNQVGCAPLRAAGEIIRGRVTCSRVRHTAGLLAGSRWVRWFSS